ncbi:ATP-binding cassette domain-containing protein [Lentzea sp. NEAU-D13]|uniref:ATP-binding cassette domain-containing protein n=1 Tax=Lentzea alba TaxID=2714351 RepID=A0A7C9VWS1_9PSEU|nr:ATP-binding cassette domain-containing protein [Lentzea alba]NGY64235.1 ATP-binding cassette domain-containing protein [Lentzea alba]
MRRGWPLVVCLTLALTFVFLGGLFAPHDPTEVVGGPWTRDGLLGTDVLGRDVLSRLLAGGSVLLAVAVPSGLAAGLLGTATGLAAAWSPRLERVVLRVSAGLLAVPGLLVTLACAVTLPSWVAVPASMVLLGTPLSARVVHAAAAPLRRAGFVQAAVVRGERTSYVLVGELLPAVAATVLSDLGLRIVAAFQLAVAVHVLGLGPAPPVADWAVMIRENLPGVVLNPWSVLAPAAAVAAVTTVVLLGLDLLGARIVPPARRTARVPPPASARSGRGLVELRGVVLQSDEGITLFDLTVARGEVLGIVGASGSGKTTLLRLLLGDVRPGAHVVGGELFLDGTPVAFGSTAARRWRRRNVGLVPQDPVAALDPLRRIGSSAPLARLGLPPDIGKRRPHALSGGQTRRVVFARAIHRNPALLLLDEPTSGLDPVTKALVTEEIAAPQRSTVIVTHDLEWARSVCDRVVELRSGALRSATDAPVAAPRAAIAPGEVVLRLENVAVPAHSTGEHLLREVSLTLRRGEMVAVVGASGAGKSTLLRALAGLHPLSGHVHLAGRMALLGQDPAGELNPAHTLAHAVGRPLRLVGEHPGRVPELLAEAGLGEQFLTRKPGQCSGGQRQRAALVRALAGDPDVLLADEPTSALDRSTAEVVLGLVNRRRAAGLAVLLVTHDEVLAEQADRVVDVVDGRCVERTRQ